MLKRKAKDRVFGIILIIPVIVILAGLILYPLINATVLSLHSQLIYEIKGKFIGLENYIDWLTDANFWKSFKLSLIWSFSTIFFQVIIGIAVALIFNEKFKGRTIARGFVLLPFFMPTVAVALMWRWMYNESYGILNHALITLGIIDKGIGWLASPTFALISLIIVGVWRFFPFVVINVLARLQTIDQVLYEAAKVDGANWWQRFWYITIPEIKGVLLIVILLRWIFMFNKFDLLWIISRGGPGTSTTTLPILTYRSAFEGMQIGKGSAVAIITFLIVFISIVLYIKRTKAHEGGN